MRCRISIRVMKRLVFSSAARGGGGSSQIPTYEELSKLPDGPDYSAFETDIMRNEFERLAARQPTELLSGKRTNFQPLPIWSEK